MSETPSYSTTLHFQSENRPKFLIGKIPLSAERVNGTFENCSGLRAIHCKSTTPPETPNEYWNLAFYSGIYSRDDYNATYQKATLYIPKGSYEAYKSKYEWGLFEKIIEE